jgi:phosphatidylserine/phosphatidylglycerophosphate/cardiolipin synthase-like enzyme
VKINLYPAPFVWHSKHFSVDDDVTVGSSNMGIGSFNLGLEISVMCVSRSLTVAMGRAAECSAAMTAVLPTHHLGQSELGEQRGIEEGADMRNALVRQREHLDLECLM